jgi:hypothetical protein
MMTKAESLNKMREKGAEDALKLQTEAAEGKVTETEIIDREEAIPAYDHEKDYTGWPVNSPVTDEGQVWLLLQPHNAANYEGRPSALRSLWGLAHTKNPERAKPYVYPFGTSGLYQKDECMIWTDGLTYISNIENNSYTPEGYPQGWTLYQKG